MDASHHLVPLVGPWSHALRTDSNPRNTEYTLYLPWGSIIENNIRDNPRTQHMYYNASQFPIMRRGGLQTVLSRPARSFAIMGGSVPAHVLQAPAVSQTWSQSSDRTQPAVQGLDETFLLDSAVIYISPTAQADSMVRVFNMFYLPCFPSNIPIVFEGKRSPHRYTRTAASLGRQLAHGVADGFEDLSSKRLAIFETFPLQQSVVGVSYCGPWWSFCLLRRGQVRIGLFSQLFLCGTQTHTEVMDTIFDAARGAPGDPAGFRFHPASETSALDRRLRRYQRGELSSEIQNNLFAPSVL